MIMSLQAKKLPEYKKTNEFYTYAKVNHSPTFFVSENQTLNRK